MLLDAGQRVVGEGVLVVEVEALPLGDVGHAAIVSVDVGMHPRILILVAEFGAEHTFALQSGDKVVVDFG